VNAPSAEYSSDKLIEHDLKLDSWDGFSVKIPKTPAFDIGTAFSLLESIRLGWHAWFQGWYRRKKRFPVSSELVAM
jgi:hypothetical protein